MGGFGWTLLTSYPELCEVRDALLREEPEDPVLRRVKLPEPGERISNVGESQSCMVSKLRMMWKQRVAAAAVACSALCAGVVPAAAISKLLEAVALSNTRRRAHHQQRRWKNGFGGC